MDAEKLKVLETIDDDSNLGKMISAVTDAATDYGKARDGNKKAGTRVRQNMLKIGKLYKEIRKEMVECRPT